MDLILTNEERQALIDSIRADAVRALIAEYGDDLELVSPSQAAGLIDCNIKTLDSIGVPKVVLSPTVIRYRLSDLKDFIALKRAGGDREKQCLAVSSKSTRRGAVKKS